MVNKNRAIPYHAADYLKTPDDIHYYLEAAMKDGDDRVILMALRNIAKAMGGMSELARETGLSREALHRALGPKGNPRFSTLNSILHAFGLEFSLRTRKKAA